METELPKRCTASLGTDKKYDLIDFDPGVKITGAGFRFIKEKVRSCNAR